MRLKGLDGREYRVDPSLYRPHPGDERPRSRGHLKVRALLKEIFPLDIVLEEFFLPGCSTALYLDFLLLRQGIAIEVQGDQHSEFVPFFHRSRAGFDRALGRDREKANFCALNSFSLVRLTEGNESEWRRQLTRQTECSPGYLGEDRIPPD